MSNGRYVDGVLITWGTKVFGDQASRSVRGKSINGVLPTRRGGRGGQLSAASVRQKLDALAKRSPEVMVKISGGGKGMKQIRDHLDYISRNGKLDLEDQDGNLVRGREELIDFREEFRYGGFEVPEAGKYREAFNIVLSMPEGTNPEGVRRAAADFAAREFADHQYVMALHTFATDPDPHPSKHPHVHLCVKARSHSGRRLNPRKADLQRWREGFAEALKEHGIEASATNRKQRLSRNRGEKQSVRQMRLRGVNPSKVGVGRAGQKYIERAVRTEREVMGAYREMLTALAGSDSPKDRWLAQSMVERLKQVERARAMSRGKVRSRDGFER